MRSPNRLAALFALMTILVLGSATTTLAGVIPQPPPARITDSGSDLASANGEPSLVEKDGILHAVWLDKRDGTFQGVYYANSSDGGASWSQNRRVSIAPDHDWVNEPSVAVDADGNIWVMYHLYYNDTSDQLNDMVLAKSSDGGVTFTDYYQIFDGTDGQSDHWQSHLVASPDSNLLYGLLQDYRLIGADEGMDILLLTVDPAASTATGVRVNDVEGSARVLDRLQDYGPEQSIAIRDGKICAAWEDKRERFSIYGACSTDGGASFGANFRISPSDSLRPELAIAPNGDLYVIYSHDGTFERELYLRRSTDNGATWSPERTVAAFEDSEVTGWDIAVDANGQIVISFVEVDFGLNGLWMATSTDNGESFAQEFVLDADTSIARVIAAGSGTSTWAYTLYDDGDQLHGLRAVLDGVPPSAPANLTAAAAERAVQLTWNVASDANGVAGYHVYRATAAGGPYSQITPVMVRATSYVDVDLEPGSTFHYEVRAFDSTGNRGAASNRVSAAAGALGAAAYQGVIAYEQGNNVRIQTLGGDTQTIANASSPIFSPTGTHLYWSTGDFVQKRPVAGGTPTTFFEDPQHVLFDIAADENHFVTLISRQIASTVTGGVCHLYEPRVARPGVELYVSQFEWGTDVAISSDHKYAAYTSSGWCNATATSVYYPPRLCIVDIAAGTEECQVFEEIADPDFAPSGHNLVFASDITGQFEIWRAELNANKRLVNFVQLTRGPVNAPSRAPAWSSDGQWVVFQRDMDAGDGEDWRLFIVRADGVGVRPLGIAGEAPAMNGGGGGIVPGAIKTYLPAISK